MECRTCPPAAGLSRALWAWTTGEDTLAAAGERMMSRQGWRFGVAAAADAAARLSWELSSRWQGSELLADAIAFAARHPELRLRPDDLWAWADDGGRRRVNMTCLGGLRRCCVQIAYGLYGEPVAESAAAVVAALRDAHA